MVEGSSPGEDIKPSTAIRMNRRKVIMEWDWMDDHEYVDLGATTEEGREISMKSRSLIASKIGNRGPEDRIRQRCVIATGDTGIADLLRFQERPVEAGLIALEREAPIFVDIRMVEAGIIKKGHDSPVMTFIGSGDALASKRGITRTSAGVLARDAELPGSIVVIGNAPSALMTLCELVEDGMEMPALVIGVPVGFVNASESKERLRRLGLPSITTVGTRGGTPIAVAAMNEIVTIHYERSREG